MDQSDFGPTPLATRYSHLVHANRWHAWAHYHIPDAFEGLTAELTALHEAVVIEDKSPMHFFGISGPDAVRFLNVLTTRDFTDLPPGSAKYTPWLDHDGRLILETPVCRLDETTYVSIGGPLGEWLEHNRPDFRVRVEDFSDEWVVMPVQGPKARATIERAGGVPLDDLPFQHGRRMAIGGCEVYVWRIGYNSQPCFEVHTTFESAPRVYDVVTEAGRAYGILNLGQNAVHVARVEAGIIAPGWEYARAGPDANIASYVALDEEDMASPFEVGLGRLVEFDKPTDFIGKAALLAEEATGGPPRTLVGLHVDWRDIVALYVDAGTPPEISRQRDPRRHVVRYDGLPVGKASSIVWSPRLNKLIGLGQIRRDLAAPGTRLTMDWAEHGTRLVPERLAQVVHGSVNVTVAALPFVSKAGKFAGSARRHP